MSLIDKTIGKAVNFTFNSALKLGKGGAKVAGKTIMGAGAVSEKIIFKGTGALGIGIAKGGAFIGKGATKLGGKAFTKELTEEALKDSTLYERMIGKKLNAGGVAALTVGAMAVSTGGAIVDNFGNKKLGYTSVGDNLDRLVSYDGSGFVNGINKISGGDYGVMQDIVQNTFDDINQTGVSGDIVFALHNMREG